MQNLDMLLAVKGDTDKATEHLSEHYFPVSEYKRKHSVADQTTLILNLVTDDKSESIHYFSVSCDSLTPICKDEYDSNLSTAIDNNCTLYGKPVPHHCVNSHYQIHI